MEETHNALSQFYANIPFWQAFTFAYSILELIALYFVFEAITKARTSQGAIAWSLALIAFPFISIPLYKLFGKPTFFGRINARRKDCEELYPMISPFLKVLDEYKTSLKEDPYELDTIENLGDLNFVHSNAAELLIDGKETFEAIISSLEKAKDYILFQFFIIKDDELGQKLKTLLKKKSNEGIRVYFLYDAIGSHGLGDPFLDDLKASGIRVAAFKNHNKRVNRLQINFRNHRKIVVVDGLEAFIGGHNIGVEYLGKHPTLTPWRDTHLKLTGPMVGQTQVSFLEDWYWTNELYTPDDIPKLNWQIKPTDNKKGLVLPSGPSDKVETCGLMFTHFINQAKEEITIASPYFVPDGKIISALKLAALRGVKVKILLPKKPDHLMVYLARYDYFKDLMKCGIEFYLFQKGFLHQKVFLIDESIGAVGTANLDNRSFRLNFEITALLYDKDFALSLKKMLTEDLNHSKLLKYSDLNRGPFFYFLVKICRLLSPLL